MRPLIHVIYYEAWHSTTLVLQFNSLITKETKWKVNSFSQTLLFTVTLKNCFWSFEMMVKIQINYMCGSMWWPATSLHTLYLMASSNSGVRHLLGRWRYLLLEPVVDGEKGMRWSRTLWKTILIKATSSSSITSSFAIQKDHVGVSVNVYSTMLL